MSSLPSLKKRLKSVRSTGELASAMKTVATVKYSKLSHSYTQFRSYAEQLGNIQRMLGDHAFSREDKPPQMGNCVVLMSSNRGFCGGFNGELFRYFKRAENDGQYDADGENLYIACGTKAQMYFQARNMDCEVYPLSDFPSFDQARQLCERLLSLYLTNTVESVLITYQSYVNVMIQRPVICRFLPLEKDALLKSDPQVLLLPDKDAFSESAAAEILTARLYEIMLQVCTGAQAATLVSMRSACDNAEETAEKLELTINRMRQAEVTNSVIELTSGNS